ncbi:MAG: RNA-guided pseudouridylation complex pseudouridine synthase subunit Cbf5 [Planctomycetota bacterium]|jgi:H/ACA ribonucleoprotein complex subunit 4
MTNKLPFEKLQRKVIIKQHGSKPASLGSETDSIPIELLLNYGIINIDKPAGITSYKTAEQVKRILHVKKTGHGGTLDPSVTGVLPVALGRATRITQAFLAAGKEYICEMHLHKLVGQKQIREVIENFTDIIEQIPPVKSAVKRQKRKREIYYMDILEINKRDVSFKIGCQGGTYIRKLVHDMGTELGTGAHMAKLRRTKAGSFTESALCTLENLSEAYKKWEQTGDENDLRKVVQSIENAVQHLGKVWIDDSVIEPVCEGWDLAVPGVIKLHSEIEVGNPVVIMTMKDVLIALGEAQLTSDQILKLEKGIAVKTKKVFMQLENKQTRVLKKKTIFL